MMTKAAEKVVSVLQDDSGSNGEGNGSFNLGSDDCEGSGMCIPFKMTPSGIMWYKCHVCLREEYDSKAMVVLHALQVIKQDAGARDMVTWHHQVL
jgi:hypothetical protein